MAGAHFADGSGLDRRDRATALLTALLARAADPDRPGLRPVLTASRSPASAAPSAAGTRRTRRAPA